MIRERILCKKDPRHTGNVFSLFEKMPGPVLQARLIFIRLSVKNVGDCGGAQSQFVDYIADTYAVLFHDGFLLPNVLLLSLYISF